MGDRLPGNREEDQSSRYRRLWWGRLLLATRGSQRDWGTVRRFDSCIDWNLTISRLLSIPHIKRIRFASKGLAVAPCRINDETDAWTNTLIDLSNKGRDMAKQVCLHTHINHVNEITWVTREAANRLFKHGVIVRNQSVLLNGVNDTKEDLSNLIQELASMNIQPVSILILIIQSFEIFVIQSLMVSVLIPRVTLTDIDSTTSINVTWYAASKTFARH